MNSSKNKLRQHFTEHVDVQRKTLDLVENNILKISEKLSDALSKNKKIMWCGNGGSATDAMHLSGELVGRFNKDRKSLKSICLSSDTSNLTCISNDYGYEKVFSRQIEGLGDKGDVLICLSTSGKSKNILSALKVAKNLEIFTISFLGKNGGDSKGLSDLEIIIPSNTTARIQEMHLFIGHIICDLIEEKLKLK